MNSTIKYFELNLLTVKLVNEKLEGERHKKFVAYDDIERLRQQLGSSMHQRAQTSLGNYENNGSGSGLIFEKAAARRPRPKSSICLSGKTNSPLLNKRATMSNTRILQ